MNIIPVQFSENDLVDIKNNQDYITAEKRKPEIGVSGPTENRTLCADKPNVLFPANYCNGKSMSQPRFIKFIPSEEAEWLQENHPNAFLLLCQIAKRARRTKGSPDGLEIGESQIGDYKKAGIETRDKYRYALKVLVQRKHIEISETRMNRKEVIPSHFPEKSKNSQNAPSQTPTEGTKVKLLKSDVWDINIELNTQCYPQSVPSQPPVSPQEQEYKEYKKEKNIDINPSSIVESSQRPIIYQKFAKSDNIYYSRLSKKAKAPSSPQAAELLVYFNNSLKSNIPEVLKVSDSSEATYFDFLLKQGRDSEEIKKVIDFAHTHTKWWRGKSRKPSTLKQNYQDILIQLNDSKKIITPFNPNKTDPNKGKHGRMKAPPGYDLELDNETSKKLS